MNLHILNLFYDMSMAIFVSSCMSINNNTITIVFTLGMINISNIYTFPFGHDGACFSLSVPRKFSSISTTSIFLSFSAFFTHVW